MPFTEVAGGWIATEMHWMERFDFAQNKTVLCSDLWIKVSSSLHLKIVQVKASPDWIRHKKTLDPSDVFSLLQSELWICTNSLSAWVSGSAPIYSFSFYSLCLACKWHTSKTCVPHIPTQCHCLWSIGRNCANIFIHRTVSHLLQPLQYQTS